jgi:hypothetical protein
MTAVLDTIERLLRAAGHPDIVDIERYGPNQGAWGPSVKTPGMDQRGITGVRVTHQSTATASLWEANWHGETPVDTPAVMPPPRQNRGPRLAILTAWLLDIARPGDFKAWRLVALPEVGKTDTRGATPVGLSVITADGQRVLLRASATGAVVGEDPLDEPFPDWEPPPSIT